MCCFWDGQYSPFQGARNRTSLAGSGPGKEGVSPGASRGGAKQEKTIPVGREGRGRTGRLPRYPTTGWCNNIEPLLAGATGSRPLPITHPSFSAPSQFRLAHPVFFLASAQVRAYLSLSGFPISRDPGAGTPPPPSWSSTSVLVLLRFGRLGNTAPWVNRKIYSQISHFTSFTSLHSTLPLTHPLRLCPAPQHKPGAGWDGTCHVLAATISASQGSFLRGFLIFKLKAWTLCSAPAYVPVRHLISLAPRIGWTTKLTSHGRK